MPIIDRLKIEGFKSIWSDELDLARLNVFIGINGAGKSNILESIAMVSAAIEGEVSYENLHNRGSRLSSSAIFRSAFRNKDRRSSLGIEVSVGSSSYRLGLNAVDRFSFFAESIWFNGTKIAGRSNNGATIRGKSLPSKLDSSEGIFPLLKASSALDSNKDASVIAAVDGLSRIADYSIYAPSTPLLRGLGSDPNPKEPLGLFGGGLAEAVREVIQDPKRRKEMMRFFSLLGWFKSFGFAQEEKGNLLSKHINIPGLKLMYEDKYMKANFNKLYAYDVSEGALYVLFILVLLVHERSPRIFALDNLDSALNPSLARHLVGQMAEILEADEERQVFVTTHNPSALDGLDLFNPNHRLFVVERDGSGHTKTRRISPPTDMTRDRWDDQYGGLRLSEIWLSGAIGGLPTAY